MFVKSPKKVPHSGHRPRSKRQVIHFTEAFENLKTSQNGSVVCAAFHSFERCRKEISLLDSDFIASLDQFDLTDLQAPIKLMPLMLCSTHWGKTIYHNALFLDWLSVYGSKKDHPHFETTVVDYQSAILIDDKDISVPEIASGSAPESGGRPVSAPTGTATEENHLDTRQGEAIVHVNNDPIKLILTDPGPDHITQHFSQTSVIVGMESYASIEIGVAKLEIMYQDNLNCIAMTSDGWRCPKAIPTERLLKARELLTSYAISGSALDLVLLPGLVLCPGHAAGELAEIYSEKWMAFSEQRLSKDEAMSKFNADSWMSVQFFSSGNKNDLISPTPPLNRAKSASELTLDWGEKYVFGSTKHAKEKSLLSPEISEQESLIKNFDFSLSGPSLVSHSRALSSGEGFLKSMARFDRSAEHYKAGLKLQFDSEPVLVNNKVRLNDMKESIGFSASEEVIKEGNSQGRNTVVQDSQMITPSIQPSSPGAPEQAKSIPSPDVINEQIIKWMSIPHIPGGYVPIIWSACEGSCKFGTVTNVNVRQSQIEAGCQLQHFYEHELEAVFTLFPKQAVQLVKLDLQYFRAKLSCEGHHRSERDLDNLEVQLEHEKWFKVPVEVAIDSAKLWCSFVSRAYNYDGTIKDEWTKKLRMLPSPSHKETSLLKRVVKGGDEIVVIRYHRERVKRFDEWMGEGDI